MSKIIETLDNLEAIIFDFDGVLADSTEIKTQAFGELYSKYGKKVQNLVINHHLNNFGLSRFEKFKYFEEIILKSTYSEEKGQILSREFSRIVVDKVVNSDWIKGAEKFLNYYYRKLPLFVASGTPQKELVEIIDQREMTKYFKSIHGTPKTKSQIINELVEKYNFNPIRVLMIGDALADFRGAKAAGVQFIGRVNVKDNNIFDKKVLTFSDFNVFFDFDGYLF